MPSHLTARRMHIQQAVSTLRTGAQRRYPPELRSEIADYSRERVECGVALSRVGSEIGVSHPTLLRIVDEMPPRMRRVRVARPRATQLEPRVSIVVRGPAGLVIEGLEIEGVAALFQALS